MNTATLNLRTISAVALCVGKEATRFYLQGVRVEISPRAVVYVATDGHRLLVARDELKPDAEPNTLLGAFTIPVESCKALKAPKRGDALATLTYVSGDMKDHENGNGLTLSLAIGGTSHGFQTIAAHYPDWRRVLPCGALHGREKDHEERAHSVTYNPVYLADFAKAAGLLDISAKPHLVPNGESAAFVWFGDHEDVFGVIMPIRSRDMRGREAPEWISPRAEPEEVKAA